MWDVYVNKKENIIKSGYSVEVVGRYVKNFLFGFVDDRVLEEETYHDEIGLWGFGYNLF